MISLRSKSRPPSRNRPRTPWFLGILHLRNNSPPLCGLAGWWVVGGWWCGWVKVIGFDSPDSYSVSYHVTPLTGVETNENILPVAVRQASNPQAPAPPGGPGPHAPPGPRKATRGAPEGLQGKPRGATRRPPGTPRGPQRAARASRGPPEGLQRLLLTLLLGLLLVLLLALLLVLLLTISDDFCRVLTISNDF